MSSEQLDDLRDAQMAEYIAAELKIGVEVYEELGPEVYADESGLELIVSFYEESPADLLAQVKDLDSSLCIRVSYPYHLEHAWPGDWDDTGHVDDPKSEFDSNYWDLSYLITELEAVTLPGRAASLQCRMIFKESFSALEAYLGDMLQNAAEDDGNIQLQLVHKIVDLTKMKPTLPEVASSPNFVQETVRKYLQEILYHNFEKVSQLYEVAFNIDIWPNSELKDRLYMARLKRHDWTHRNGRPIGKDASEELSLEYVKETLSAIYAVIEHIDARLAESQP